VLDADPGVRSDDSMMAEVGRMLVGPLLSGRTGVCGTTGRMGKVLAVRTAMTVRVHDKVALTHTAERVETMFVLRALGMLNEFDPFGPFRPSRPEA
jgi:hypothetical protein